MMEKGEMFDFISLAYICITEQKEKYKNLENDFHLLLQSLNLYGPFAI